MLDYAAKIDTLSQQVLHVHQREQALRQEVVKMEDAWLAVSRERDEAVGKYDRERRIVNKLLGL